MLIFACLSCHDLTTPHLCIKEWVASLLPSLKESCRPASSAGSAGSRQPARALQEEWSPELALTMLQSGDGPPWTRSAPLPQRLTLLSTRYGGKANRPGRSQLIPVTAPTCGNVTRSSKIVCGRRAHGRRLDRGDDVAMISDGLRQAFVETRVNRK